MRTTIWQDKIVLRLSINSMLILLPEITTMVCIPEKKRVPWSNEFRKQMKRWGQCGVGGQQEFILDVCHVSEPSRSKVIEFWFSKLSNTVLNKCIDNPKVDFIWNQLSWHWYLIFPISIHWPVLSMSDCLFFVTSSCLQLPSSSHGFLLSHLSS